ncbi:MAG: uroporphyrinogen-III synthase [Sneathiella sp.]|nr:uroporphyrinogen-III synthase [Sneathiella sp.]
MKLLITRPVESSEKLARRLASMGHDVVLCPLLHIEFREAGPLPLNGVQAFIVTSANGIEGLIKRTGNRDLPLYAVGEKTAEAAKEAGFKNVLSADGDVDTLTALITKSAVKSDGDLLHVGGARLAGDLKVKLEHSGFSYRREILYDAVDETDFQKDAIRALEDETLDGVVLFSPHTAKIFATIIEHKGLSPHLKGVTAWCLSNNVAVEIADLPFKESFIAPSPTEASLLGQLAVKSANVSGTVKMDTDRTREQNVSKTPSNDKESKSEQSRGGNTGATDETFSVKPAADVKKPLPDALTGKGEVVQPTPAKSNAGRIALALVVFFLMGLAAWPLILPKIGPYIPAEATQILQGYLGIAAEDQKFEIRLLAVEKSLKDRSAISNTTNLGPITASLKENNDLVASLNGKVSDLTDKSGLERLRLAQRLQAEETNSQNLSASIDALKEQLLKIKVAEPVSTTAPTASVTSEPTPEVLASLNGLQAALDQLKSELASVRQGLSSTQTTALAQKDQLSSLSSVLQARIAADATNRSDGEEALVLLALGQLHRESRAHQPFEGALRQALAAAPKSLEPKLVGLSDIAKSGAKARQDLITEFSIIANDITQASRLPTSEAWYGKTLHNIASLVKFRRVDDLEGDSVDAVVARAEARLKSNDLAGATAVLKDLTGDPAAVAVNWIVAADKRALVDRSLNELLGKATALNVQNTTANK